MTYLIFLILLLLPTYLIRFSVFGIPTTFLEILIYLVFVYGLFLWALRLRLLQHAAGEFAQAFQFFF